MRPLEPPSKSRKKTTNNTTTALEISPLSSVFGTPVNYYISINSITFKQIQFKKAEVISLAMRIIRQDANFAAAPFAGEKNPNCSKYATRKRKASDRRATPIGTNAGTRCTHTPHNLAATQS